MVSIFKRASFYTTLASLIVYCDWNAIRYGGWVYDDAGSVIKNVVVNGHVPWQEAFTRDFWGTEMKDIQSHKSFRPLTTLTLKANYVYAMSVKPESEKHPESFTFRVVNLILHGITTFLITEATHYILPDIISCLIVGFLFGLHPVHAEVVSNVTSRGEMLMSCFFLLAFISYASQIRKIYSASDTRNIIVQFICIYIFPWIFMTMSLFSKEQGATALITCVAYDFIKYHGNLQLLSIKIKNRDWNSIHFIKRTFLLAIQTLVVVLWRKYLNGETTPDFIEAQNPAGFASDRLTRAFSVSWVYCLYIRDAIWPYYLCPDWSGVSIDLIRHLQDPRAFFVISLWYFSGTSMWSMIVDTNKTGTRRQENTNSNGTIEGSKRKDSNASNSWFDEDTLRKINMSIWAFTFSPFLLSSNILVVVGLMKADRVIYLPIYGFCLLEALLISTFLKGRKVMSTAMTTRRQQLWWFAYFTLMYQLIVLAARTHERNLAWSNSLKLWEAAYAINPRSHHTMYNYGYELSIKQRYEEAEIVMRPIGDPRVEGPSNTFVYAMVLFNLDQCDLANELLDEAFEVIEEKRLEGGPRNTPSSLSRSESNLLVARAHCVDNDDMNLRGATLYEAVQADPSNEYAVGLAHEFMQKLEQFEKIKQQMGQG